MRRRTIWSVIGWLAASLVFVGVVYPIVVRPRHRRWGALLLDPAEFVMVRKQLLGIKWRAERLAASQVKEALR